MPPDRTPFAASTDVCGCGGPLVACERCGDSRCLSCDPYDASDACSAATTESREPNQAEAALYRTLHKALKAVRAGDTELAEDTILDALDGVTGWCHSRYRAFPNVDFNGVNVDDL